ncbi:10088_t:CDS:2, partial [Diversispora eburnea]
MDVQSFSVGVPHKFNKIQLVFIGSSSMSRTFSIAPSKEVYNNDAEINEEEASESETTITQNRNNNKEKGVKFWDIPVGMCEQEFKHMLNHKFGKVISCTMSTR